LEGARLLWTGSEAVFYGKTSKRELKGPLCEGWAALSCAAVLKETADRGEKTDAHSRIANIQGSLCQFGVSPIVV
jgi:hypothetical protein